MIVAALLFGAVYTLPNLYPDDPVVQVSPRQADAPQPALLGQVERVLQAAGLASTGATLDASGARLRFADTDAQQRAREVLQDALGASHVVALGFVSAAPPQFAAIGALPLYLGLDLRGGVHFLLEVNAQAAVDRRIDRHVAAVRALLRERGVHYSGAARAGAAIVVRLPGTAERLRARNEIGIAFADLAAHESESEAGELRLTLRPEAERRIRQSAVEQNAQILRNRVNALGVAEPVVTQQGDDRIAVQLPGLQDVARAKELIGRTAMLEIRLVHEENGAQDPVQAGKTAFDTEVLPLRGGGSIRVRRSAALAGDRVIDAQPGFDPNDNSPNITIVLDPAGARIFRDLSRENVGTRMAVVLAERDRTEVIMAPKILGEIAGGRIVVIGNMSTRETSDLSLLVRSGSLAAPMAIIEERAIGPSLGQENVDRGFRSVGGGLVAVAVFMTVYYRLMGAIAVAALALNLLLLVALLSVMQATLTLPGIAAIALTLGMAIDANVLINERIREELRWGAPAAVALRAGYDRAWGTILDSNVTTLIAGLALFAFGSGAVRGFAVVHCLGILTSLFSAVLLSRGIVDLVYGRGRDLQRLSIG